MSEKLIAIQINRYSEDNFLSGGEKVDFSLVKAFAELGFDIDLYCNESTVETSKYIKNIYISKPLQDKNYLFTFGENFCSGKTFIYIHENSRHYRDKYTRTAFTNFIQNIFAHKRKLQIQQMLKQEKEIIENIPFILVPSTIVKEDLLEFFNINENNIFILPPCINKIEPKEKEQNKVFTFGLSARGFGNKGGWQVILASLFLKLTGKKFKVLIIYPFTTTIKLVEIVVTLLGLGKRIKFLDYCENMQEDFYEKIDCLVVASKRESFGLVAPEAMQNGIPTIVSSRCGIKDFVKHNENGFIYEYEKPILNLFKIMKYVFDNRNDLQNISENSKKIYEELTYEKLKQNLKDFLIKTGYLRY